MVQGLSLARMLHCKIHFWDGRWLNSTWLQGMHQLMGGTLGGHFHHCGRQRGYVWGDRCLRRDWILRRDSIRAWKFLQLFSLRRANISSQLWGSKRWLTSDSKLDKYSESLTTRRSNRACSSIKLCRHWLLRILCFQEEVSCRYQQLLRDAISGNVSLQDTASLR